MKPHRYRVTRIDNTERDEPPTYEVRRNPGGTADDWHGGDCMAVFDNQAAADAFAQALRTFSLKACPRCTRGLSNTSFEQYCAYDDCLWNNDQ